MYTIYHNTRCSKSRATHKILEDAGVALEERFYLENPPTEEELHNIIALLGLAPIDVVRTGEGAWIESGLTSTSPEADVLSFIVSHPIVLERPIVVKDDMAAVIGRPPENVRALL